MIPQILKISNEFLGTSFVSPAYGRVGTRAITLPSARKKFFGEAQARAGREGKGVWGKGIPAPPERIFRNRRRGFLGKKSELFLKDTTLDDFFRPRPSLRSGLGLRRAENIFAFGEKTKIFKLSV